MTKKRKVKKYQVEKNVLNQKELLTTKIENKKYIFNIKGELYWILILYAVYVLFIFFLNYWEVINDLRNLGIKMREDFLTGDITHEKFFNLLKSDITIIIIWFTIIILISIPIILPMLYFFYGSFIPNFYRNRNETGRIKFLFSCLWSKIRRMSFLPKTKNVCYYLFLFPIFYILIALLVATLILIIYLINYHLAIICITLLLLCFFVKQEIIIISIVTVFAITHILRGISEEASLYFIFLFSSFLTIPIFNSRKKINEKFGKEGTVNFLTIKLIIEKIILRLKQIVKIENVSIIKFVIFFCVFIVSGQLFFNKNTMMISDNLLMQKITQEDICQECEKGIYFIENNKAGNIITLDNVVQYAIINNIINLDYKKNNILNRNKKEKYRIKEYNIPDYYISFNSLIYTTGIITLIDNAQTKNYTHNNIITEYIIWFYSIFGKLLMGLIAYKIYLIRTEKPSLES